MSQVLGLSRHNDPGPLLHRFAEQVAQDPAGHGQVAIHMFSFGNLQQTAMWAAQQHRDSSSLARMDEDSA